MCRMHLSRFAAIRFSAGVQCPPSMLRSVYMTVGLTVGARLQQDGALSEGSGAGAVVIGQKEMFQAVSEELTKAGVPSEKILTNF